MPSKIKRKVQKRLPPRSKVSLTHEDEEIESPVTDDEIELPDIIPEDDLETPQEKRLRLAKEYISHIEEEENDYVNMKLTEEMLDKSGKLQRSVAHKYNKPLSNNIICKNNHKLTPTSAIFSTDGYIFTASKDGDISMKKIKTLKLKSSETNSGKYIPILSLAISSDNKYLALGGLNRLINIYDPQSFKLIHTFKGHKKTISGLVFRHNTHQLYSSSFDRCIKIWDLDQMGYVDTLFGHQECITDIDSFIQERCLSSGGRDSTAHLWKITEESQLIYRFSSGCSVDRIRYINEDHFVAGTDEGSLSIWHVNKKRPLCTFYHHDLVKNLSSSQDVDTTAAANALFSSPNIVNYNKPWITAIATIRNSDLIATGSSDNLLKFWKCGPDFRSVSPLFSIEIPGFINSLEFSSDGRYLVAAVGKEHRFGRWKVMKQAKNRIYLIKFF